MSDPRDRRVVPDFDELSDQELVDLVRDVLPEDEQPDDEALREEVKDEIQFREDVPTSVLQRVYIILDKDRSAALGDEAAPIPGKDHVRMFRVEGETPSEEIRRHQRVDFQKRGVPIFGAIIGAFAGLLVAGVCHWLLSQIGTLPGTVSFALYGLCMFLGGGLGFMVGRASVNAYNKVGNGGKLHLDRSGFKLHRSDRMVHGLLLLVRIGAAVLFGLVGLLFWQTLTHGLQINAKLAYYSGHASLAGFVTFVIGFIFVFFCTSMGWIVGDKLNRRIIGLRPSRSLHVSDARPDSDKE